MERIEEKVVKRLTFFKNKEIRLINENTADLNPECFLVKDVTSNQKIKVRLAPSSAANSVAKEKYILEMLKKANVRNIPDIYSLEKSKGYDVLIYQYFEGESIEKLSELSEKDYLIIRNAIINSMLEYRALKSPKPMLFNQTFENWSNLFGLKMNEHLNSRANLEFFDQRVINEIKGFHKTQLPSLQEVDCCFIHYDIKPKNIVFDKESRSAFLIDFELARFGDPMMELARIKSFSQSDEYSALLVNPILGYFNGNKDVHDLSDNIFSLYLLYCYIVYHRYFRESMLKSSEIYYHKQAIYWHKKVLKTVAQLH